jgi:hypothetical protein
MKHPESTQQHKVLHHHHKHVLRHGLLLILLLLIFHVVAFGVFYYLEMREIRADLIHLSQTTSDDSFDNRYLQESPSESSVILRRDENDEGRDGFSEKKIGQHDYFVYQDPDSSYIVAKSEADLQAELTKVGSILAMLFLVECITFFFWYNNIKELLKEIFSV